ncbi:MAG: hypothetical protein ACTS3F_06655 [Phycisphaerales bacterium]
MEVKMATDFLATLRELRAFRHRRVVERARQIVDRDNRKRRADAHRAQDHELDKTVADSFPAGDPVAPSSRPGHP